jgi:hypothetical protein
MHSKAKKQSSLCQTHQQDTQPNGRAGIRNAYQLFKYAKSEYARHGTGKQTCFDGSYNLQPEKNS